MDVQKLLAEAIADTNRRDLGTKIYDTIQAFIRMDPTRGEMTLARFKSIVYDYLHDVPPEASERQS